MLFLGLKLNTKPSTSNGRTHYSYSLYLGRKIKEKKCKIVDEKKISKARYENKLTVTIKRLSWDSTLYWKFMCTDKNNEKNKTNNHLPLYTPVTAFLIEKTSKPMTLKFSDFQFVFINCFARN